MNYNVYIYCYDQADHSNSPECALATTRFDLALAMLTMLGDREVTVIVREDTAEWDMVFKVEDLAADAACTDLKGFIYDLEHPDAH